MIMFLGLGIYRGRTSVNSLTPYARKGTIKDVKSLTFFLPLTLLALGFSLLPYHYITAQTTYTDAEQATMTELASVLQALKTLLSSLFPQTQAQTSGLVGHWTFNEGSGTTANDSSGNNNTGTLVNGPIWTTGKIGQALNFDGVNDYVEVRDAGVSIPSLAFGTGPFSVSFWIKVTSPEDFDILIGARRNYGWQLQDRATFLRFFINDSVGSDTIDSTINPFDNAWHHIVGLRDGTNLRLYIDSIAQTPVADTLRNTDEAPLPGLRFGAGGAVFADSFHGGLIDEVRIYNRALTTDEIKRLYNMGR